MSWKVLLITPPYHCGILESAGSWVPTGLVYVAGSLRKAGYQVDIYDAMTKYHTHEQIRESLARLKPDIVAVSAITATVVDAVEVLQSAKQVLPKVITVMGNVHPSFCWEELLKRDGEAIDYIIRGEGEITMVELLNCLKIKGDLAKVQGIAYLDGEQIMATQERPLIEDLDALPTAWDLIHWPDYTYRTKPNSTLAVVSSSRGCPQSCRFCSQQRFWKQSWRPRSPENFVAELVRLNHDFGVDVVMLADEIPTLDRSRWERILDLLMAKKLDLELLIETRVDDIIRDRDILAKYRAAGIVHIYVGAESASQGGLDRYRKNIALSVSKEAIHLINQHDIVSETSFVLGLPEETPENIQKTLEFAKYMNPDMAFFLAIAPWPYSQIYPELRPFIEVFDYRAYNLVKPIVKPLAMSLEELERQLILATGSFFQYKLANRSQLSSYKKKFMDEVLDLILNHSYLMGSAVEEMLLQGKV